MVIAHEGLFVLTTPYYGIKNRAANILFCVFGKSHVFQKTEYLKGIFSG